MSKTLNTVLVVPGLGNSGPAHWQSWLVKQLHNAQRIEQQDWDRPEIIKWTASIQAQMMQITGNVWLVAHSFGCLASIYASQEHAGQIAGAIWVAPPDPRLFSTHGFVQQVQLKPNEESPALAENSAVDTERNLDEVLPRSTLPFPSLLIASSNDPWCKLTTAKFLAERWGSAFLNLGESGHINTDAGYGPWPKIIELLQALQATHRDGLVGMLPDTPGLST